MNPKDELILIYIMKHVRLTLNFLEEPLLSLRIHIIQTSSNWKNGVGGHGKREILKWKCISALWNTSEIMFTANSHV